MDKDEYESEAIFRMVTSMNLEDGEDSRTLFFGTVNLREMVKRHVETISGRVYKNSIIREIHYKKATAMHSFAVRGDRIFLFEQIESTMRSIDRLPSDMREKKSTSVSAN